MSWRRNGPKGNCPVCKACSFLHVNLPAWPEAQSTFFVLSEIRQGIWKGILWLFFYIYMLIHVRGRNLSITDFFLEFFIINGLDNTINFVLIKSWTLELGSREM